MLQKVQDFLQTRAGKAFLCVALLAAVVIVFQSVRTNLGPNYAASTSSSRLFICAQTGKTFHAEITAGSAIPIYSPYSKKNTGYRPEYCFWNADGTQRRVPTPVLLAELAGQKGPTFCPDCGRLVVSDNPPGVRGHAPPTKEEFARRFKGGTGEERD